MIPSLGSQANPNLSSGEGGMPIGWFLPLVVAGLTVAALLPVVTIGCLGAENNTSRLLRDRSELVLAVVADRVAAPSTGCQPKSTTWLTP